MFNGWVDDIDGMCNYSKGVNVFGKYGSKDIKVEKWDDSDDFEVRYIVYDIMFFFVSFRLLRICLLLFN